MCIWFYPLNYVCAGACVATESLNVPTLSEHLLTVTLFIRCDLEAFFFGRKRNVLHYECHENWARFVEKYFKILKVVLYLIAFFLFNYLIWTELIHTCVWPSWKVMRWIDRRQMMILCVHVDFNACCVSVYPQRVSCHGKIRGVCELLSPASWTNSKTSVRFTLSICRDKNTLSIDDLRKLQSVKFSVGLVEILCIIVYRFPSAK